MNTLTARKQLGIQLTISKQYDDLDFADDQALLLRALQQMQEQTNIVADNPARLGLIINRGKSKVFKTNSSNNTPITAQG
ncbi:hypothetical protein DPMN_026082 [Dreissena polymorpha]|uniref:Reverse transcriptase domain-containing protein n=1 Tax=Dreissena polymorpha TaxID=45954 RepID=A0A9D4LSR3_DREPO|nr:hypothetical protein DPMN_026082 [Dreissena polymorpha]